MYIACLAGVLLKDVLSF